MRLKTAKKLFSGFIINVMKINGNYSPSFSAKLVSTKQIGKLVKNAYQNDVVSFVEIEPHNANDINALGNAAKEWLYGDFACNVYHAACSIRDDSKYYKNSKVYALTSQNSNLEKLDSKNILGLVHVEKFSEGNLFIEHIVANPEIIKSRTPEYNGIGTAILRSLKELCYKISCFPSKTESVIKFYYKNGFVEISAGTNCFVWYK
jgi:hypothetical protein